MNIPTIASIKKAASSHEGVTVGHIDVGIRDDADGEWTEDSNLWPGWNDGDPDGDLVDGPLPLKNILKGWRMEMPRTSIVLDLYLYRPESQNINSCGMISNLDLWYDQETDAWYVRNQWPGKTTVKGTKVLFPKKKAKPKKSNAVSPLFMRYLRF